MFELLPTLHLIVKILYSAIMETLLLVPEKKTLNLLVLEKNIKTKERYKKIFCSLTSVSFG